MGNEIKSNYIENKIRIADWVGGNDDGKIDKNERNAIYLFRDYVTQDYEKGMIDKATFQKAMRLHPTPLRATEAEIKELRAERKEERENKKLYKEQEQNRNSARTATLSELTSLVSKGATLDNVVELLSKKLFNEKYKDAVAQVEFFVNGIYDVGFNSKEDIQKLKKAVIEELELAGVDKTDREIIDKLVELAEKEQIEKEYQELVKIYNTIKKYEYGEHKIHNFEYYIEAMKPAMDYEGIKETSYYSGKAYDMIIAHIKEDCDGVVDANRAYTTGETARAVKAELHDMRAKGDKVAQKAINNDKDDTKLDARYNKFHRNADDLKTITRKELEDELGDDLVNELDKAYLPTVQNEDDTYDLTALVEIFDKRMGDNYKINRSTDVEMSEYKHIKDDIRELTGRDDLSRSDYKKLRKLCAVKMEQSDHSASRAFGVDRIRDAIIGGVAALGTSVKINVNHQTDFILSTNLANQLEEQFGAKGIDVDVTELGNAKVKVSIRDTKLVDLRALEVIGGIGLGYLQGALLSMIVGAEKDETSCFSVSDFDYSDPDYTNLENYEEKIKAKYPGTKGEAIVALAKTFKDENGNFDRQAFDSAVNNIAGLGSRITCEEMNNHKIVQIKQNKPTQTQEVVMETPHTIAIKDIEGEKPEFANIPTIDGTHTTWEKLVTQYDCLNGIEIDPNKYPTCAKNRGKLAVRLLKVAQAVTDGNYSYDRLMTLAEKTFKSNTYEVGANNKKTWTYEELKDFEGINYNVLVNTMNATELGKDVRVPDLLADCKRNANVEIKHHVDKNDQAKGNEIKKSDNRGNAEYKVKDGTDSEYLVKFDNGDVETYNTEAERNEAILENAKKHNGYIKELEWQE